MNPILQEIEAIRGRAQLYSDAYDEWLTTEPETQRDLELVSTMRETESFATQDRAYLLGILDALLTENAALRRYELTPADTVNAAHGE